MGSSYSVIAFETLITLVVVCGLAVAVVYGSRRVGWGRARGPIRLLGQLPLDARRSVYLVGVGKRVLVLGASEMGITKLASMPTGHLDNELTPPPALSFDEVLSRVLRNKPKSTGENS
jgi:flagellar biogenesis protein FliO